MEVDANVLGPTNLFEEAPGVWSIMMVGPESHMHLNVATTIQLRGDARLLEMCTPEVELLKEHGVFDDELNYNPEKTVCIFPTRTVLFKLSSGGVFVFSPSKILEGMREFIDGLGGVRVVYAAHKFNLLQWQKLWPDALWFDCPQMQTATAANPGLEAGSFKLLPDPATGYRCAMEPSDDMRVKDFFTDFDLFGVWVGSLSGVDQFDFVPYHRPTKIATSADLLYTAHPSGHFESAGIGYPTSDPVTLAVRTIWRKSVYDRWGGQLPSRMLPVYRVATSANPSFWEGRFDFRFDEALAFVNGATDYSKLHGSLDALCELDLSKFIPCHTMCTVPGKLAAECLKKSWAFTRPLKGQKGAVDFATEHGKTVKEYLAKISEPWAGALAKEKKRVAIERLDGGVVADNVMLSTLADSSVKFIMVDTSDSSGK